MLDYGKRRDNCFYCDFIKGDLKDKFFKQSYKFFRFIDVFQRYLDNIRVVIFFGVGQLVFGIRKEIVFKCNGFLIKVNYNQIVVKVFIIFVSLVKNWGGFWILKKGEWQQQGEVYDGVCYQYLDYLYLGLG